MCELLGMNTQVPATVSFSFQGFAKRGGETGEHADGWGIAFYEETGCRTFLDHTPACSSALADWVRQYPIKSRNVLAHVRKATQGSVGLNNCHPFVREWQGKYWSFCHNGNLKDFDPELPCSPRPVGDTDSERAFCHMLHRLNQTFATECSADLEVLAPCLHQISTEIARHGTFNYLLSQGDLLFAHCSTHLHYLVRQPPFSQAQLVDDDICIDFCQHNSAQDRMVVVATHPLTRDEQWVKIAPGTLMVFDKGLPVWQHTVS